MLGVIFLAACSSGDLVVLGKRSPSPFVFGTPVAVAELASTVGAGNPTLTYDMLEIFFSRNEGADSRVWVATRAARNEPFGTASVITSIQADASEESSPAISSDGLTLWFGSNRPGTVGEIDIWAVTRESRASAWSSPVNVTALNSSAADIPRQPGQHGRVMPFSSQKDTPGIYQLYLGTRSENGVFSTPVPVPEINTVDLNHVDGFLTDDGMTLLYSQGPAGGHPDLWVAWRKSPSAPFDVFLPLDGINTSDYDEVDAWLSPDGRELYFSSNRSGTLQIYIAPVTRAAGAALLDASTGG